MASKTTRERTKAYVFVYGDKSEATSPIKVENGKVTLPERLEIRFTGGDSDGEVHVSKLTDLSKEMQTAMAWFGAKNRHSDTLAKPNPEYTEFDALDGSWDMLKRGLWREGGERGPNLAVIYEAVSRAKTAAKLPVPTKEDYLKKLADDKFRETVLAVPAVKLNLEKIKMEKQQAKVAEAEKAAAGGKVDALSAI